MRSKSAALHEQERGVRRPRPERRPTSPAVENPVRPPLRRPELAIASEDQERGPHPGRLLAPRTGLGARGAGPPPRPRVRPPPQGERKAPRSWRRVWRRAQAAARRWRREDPAARSLARPRGPGAPDATKARRPKAPQKPHARTPGGSPRQAETRRRREPAQPRSARGIGRKANAWPEGPPPGA